MFYASPGIVVRLTRNIDKDRGYVNGAVGVVRRVLSKDETGTPTVFTVELSKSTFAGRVLNLTCGGHFDNPFTNSFNDLRATLQPDLLDDIVVWMQMSYDFGSTLRDTIEVNLHRMFL